ncbi:hypothetical protein [Enterovibrio calviensis]|uniref:hypothetical protein n=1 Tax=Enterovibrio calviensis TaxID=91359 RepID=UPI00048420C8|nr:hypothetical protein [Enterovibrio calviensis]
MNRQTIKWGFIAAGAMNIGGVLLFSRAFTNSVINQTDPVVMSNFGLMMIAVWGLAYLGASTIQSNIRWLAGAFALEKLVYVVTWLSWFSQNSLGDVYDKDLFAGIFYTIYGANDLIFMLFFALVFWAQRNR